MIENKDFIRIKYIYLQNIITKKQYKHILDKQWDKIKILTWFELLQIIELYEPTSDLNKILIQVKTHDTWQYATISFSISLDISVLQQFHVRYKIYEKAKMLESQKQQIQKKMKYCQAKFREYQEKFDFNNIDINIFWASPLYQQRTNKLVPFKIFQGFIKGIFSTLVKSKKRSYVSTNFFNQSCFKHRNQYSIVYLACHTNTTQGKTIRRQYLIGETADGQKIDIPPERVRKIFENKKIELLILHTSYPYYHLQQIQKCEGIRSILLIKSPPIYTNDCTKFFLQHFLGYLLMNYSIKDAHTEAFIQTQKQFPAQDTCCCYHEHVDKCPSNQKLSYSRFSSYHYNKHKIQKIPNTCCCLGSVENYDHSAKHGLNLRFQFTKKSEKFYDKRFQFQDGAVQGDIIYRKGFQAKDSLLGNRYIYPQLIKVFKKPDDLKKNQNYFKIFNIFDKFYGEERLLLLQSLANFLIRRKIFTMNKMYELQDLDGVKLEKNLNILYTIFCNNNSMQTVKKLLTYEVNILLISQQNLRVRRIDNTFGEKKIEPFINDIECRNYVKAQKHLTNSLKKKVQVFFEYTFHKNYRFIYYPSNFDYNAILSAIAESHYKSDQNSNQFDGWMNLLSKQSRLLEQYLLFMLILDQAPAPIQKILTQDMKRLQFYKRLTKFITDHKQFVEINLKHFKIVFQKYFKQIQKFSLNLVICFVKLTFEEFKKGVALYEATTDSSMSLISKLLKSSFQTCNSFVIDYRIQQICRKVDRIYLLRAGLKLAKRITSSFYLYDTLEFDQQMLKLLYKKSSKSSQKNQKTIKQKVDQEQLKQVIQNIQQAKQMKSPKQPKQMKQITQVKSQKQNKQFLNLPPPEKQWRVQLQKDRKSQMLIYCLLLVNNAVIFRKNYKIVIQIDHEEQMNQYLRQNIDKFHKNSSFDGPLQSRDSKLENQQPQNNDSEGQLEKQDRKIYEEQDFISNPNSITPKFILLLLQKIQSKKPLPRIAAVSHSLAIQLLLEKCYSVEIEQQDLQTKTIKHHLQALSKIAKKFSDSYQGSKYRIAYDLFMCLILVNTYGGRQKITHTMLTNMEQDHKQIFELQQQTSQNSEDSNLQTFEIFKVISQRQHIFEKLKSHFFRFLNLKKKKFKEQNFIEGFCDAIKKWQQFNSCIENIEIEYQMGEAYLRLFNLKKMCGFKVQDKKYIEKLGVYSYNLLNGLYKLVEEALCQLSNRLLILFVAKQGEYKCMIDYQRIMKKEGGNKQIKQMKSFTSLSSECGREIQSSDQPLIKIKMQLSEQNLQMLQKHQGCKYLFICAHSQSSLPNSPSKGKKMYQDKSNNNTLIPHLLTRIQSQYIFCCSPQDLSIVTQLKKRCKNNQHIITYTFKHMLKKPDNALKLAYMIIISIMIANKIQANQNLQSAINSVCKCVRIQYGERQHSHILQPKQLLQVIQVYPNSLQIIKPNQGQQLQRICRFQIFYNELIKQDYLKQIRNILKIQPLKSYNKSALPIQRSIDCRLQIFLQNLQFYFKVQQNITNWFKICQQVDFKEKKQGRGNRESKDQNQSNSRLLNQLLNQKFLQVYRSEQKMIVVIVNFHSNRKQKWVNDILEEVLFQSEQFKLENRYINIEKKPCLISIRRQRNI